MLSMYCIPRLHLLFLSTSWCYQCTASHYYTCCFCPLLGVINVLHPIITLVVSVHFLVLSMYCIPRLHLLFLSTSWCYQCTASQDCTCCFCPLLGVINVLHPKIALVVSVHFLMLSIYCIPRLHLLFLSTS